MSPRLRGGKLKDVESDEHARLLRAFISLLPPFLVMVMPLVAAAFDSFLLALPVTVLLQGLTAWVLFRISGALGDPAGGLYSGPRAGWSGRELVRADVDRARNLLRKGDSARAVGVLEEVLAADPGNSAALFLKAQVLWEGYRDAAGAVRCLRKALDGDGCEPLAGTDRHEARRLFDRIDRSLADAAGCPKCGAAVDRSLPECPKCGVIFGRYVPPTRRPPT